MARALVASSLWLWRVVDVKTWDVVWLNDEIDLLVWRLQLLREVVDEVLVVEGDRFFTGGPKASCFLANEERLRELGVSLHHVVVALDAAADSPWDRENQQRRATADAVRVRAGAGDLMLVCDVDEVPRPEVVRRLQRELDRPVRLHMQHANYFANWIQPQPWRNSAWAFLNGQQLDHPMLRVHFGVNHEDWDGYVEEFLPDAGWHLSFLGGEEGIRRKWSVYSHQEYNTQVDTHPGHLERCFRNGVHFQGRVLLEKRSEIDPSLEPLRQARPDFFRFESAPPRLTAHGYLTWTWVRRTFHLPDRIRVAIDDNGWLFGACLLPLLALDAALRLGRRLRPVAPLHPERAWTPGLPG